MQSGDSYSGFLEVVPYPDPARPPVIRGWIPVGDVLAISEDREGRRWAHLAGRSVELVDRSDSGGVS